MPRFGLTESTIQKICGIFTHYPQVQKALIYGSRAKGNFKNGSDIDLTLLGGDDLTTGVLFNILDDIDNLLLPYTIDLSIYNDIGDPDMISHIQRVGVVFYERSPACPASLSS